MNTSWRSSEFWISHSLCKGLKDLLSVLMFMLNDFVVCNAQFKMLIFSHNRPWYIWIVVSLIIIVVSFGRLNGKSFFVLRVSEASNHWALTGLGLLVRRKVEWDIVGGGKANSGSTRTPLSNSMVCSSTWLPFDPPRWNILQWKEKWGKAKSSSKFGVEEDSQVHYCGNKVLEMWASRPDKAIAQKKEIISRYCSEL